MAQMESSPQPTHGWISLLGGRYQENMHGKGAILLLLGEDFCSHGSKDFRPWLRNGTPASTHVAKIYSIILFF